MHLGLWIFCLIKRTTAVTCTAGTTSQALYTNTWTFSSTTGSAVENIKLGSINSKIYLWGSLSGGASPSFITQSKRDDTVQWANTISTQLQWSGFGIDYTETYIYAVLGTSPGGIIRFKTIDGTFDTSRTTATFVNTDTLIKYSLSLSSSSQTVFFSVKDSGLTTYLWVWQDPNTNFNCAYDTNAGPSNSAYAFDLNVVYMAVPNTDTSFDFRKLDFSTSANVISWVSRTTSASGGTMTGFVAYDSSSTNVYGIGMQIFLIFKHI